MKRRITIMAVVVCLGLVAGWGQPLAANGQTTLDHFQCYPADSGVLVNIDVGLSDRFGEAERVVGRPILLCAPVTKCLGPEYEECFYPNQTELLTCYSIVNNKREDRVINENVDVTNQFGDHTLTVDGPKMLCVPSTINEY